MVVVMEGQVKSDTAAKKREMCVCGEGHDGANPSDSATQKGDNSEDEGRKEGRKEGGKEGRKQGRKGNVDGQTADGRTHERNARMNR
jgi:hypothetical protein